MYDVSEHYKPIRPNKLLGAANDVTKTELGLKANLRNKIPHFQGFDSSRILICRGGTPRPTGNILEWKCRHENRTRP